MALSGWNSYVIPGSATHINNNYVEQRLTWYVDWCALYTNIILQYYNIILQDGSGGLLVVDEWEVSIGNKEAMSVTFNL